MSAAPNVAVAALVALVAVGSTAALAAEVVGGRRGRRSRRPVPRRHALGPPPPRPDRGSDLRPDPGLIPRIGRPGPVRAGGPTPTPRQDRRRAGPFGSPRGPAPAWRWAPAVVACAVVASVSVPAAVVVGAAVAAGPPLRARAARRRRQAALVDEVPDVIDLCRIAVDAGCTVRLALATVVAHGHGALVDALAGVLADVERGRRLAPALAELRSLGDPVRPLLDALLAAERYGAPLAPGLERAAIEARSLRRRRGEEAARRVPVAMLFPLVLCILPALVLLTVVPLLARSLPALTP